VAHRLGVKPPALYNHFASREDLVAQVARKLSRDSTEFMVRKPGEDSMTAFRNYARKLVAFYVRNPAAARIYLFEISKGGVRGWEESAALDSWARERASRAFERSVRSGEFRDIRFGYYVAVLIAGLAALALWPSYDRASKRVSVERLQAEADDLVVRLLSPDSPPKS
jgi:AcrR family transcriptional regulator